MEINKIYNEDCRETMGKMPDNFIDLVVTSPPYNCGIMYDNYDDNKLWQDYLMWVECWLTDIRRVLKPDGRVCINVLLDMGTEDNKVRVSPCAEYYQIFKKVGIKPNGLALWTDNHRVKNTAWGSWLSASAPYIYTAYEVIMLGYKDVWKKQKEGVTHISKNEFMESCGGVWNLRTQPQVFTVANFHVDLSDRCIRLLSYEDDLVYDPFMGSGTTAVSAVQMKRNYIGSELSAEYCRIAEHRVKCTSELLFYEGR